MTHTTHSFSLLTIIILVALSTGQRVSAYEMSDDPLWEPSASEQAMLERINAARNDPLAEARRLGLQPESVQKFTGNIDHLAPLAWNFELTQAAYKQNTVMVSEQYFDHVSVAGKDANDYPAEVGYTAPIAQNLAAGPDFKYAATMHNTFFIDRGIASEGHRRNILEPDAREIGISRVESTGFYRYVWTADFGFDTHAPAMILGVVYQDANGNGVYDENEGIGSVNITVTGPDGESTVQSWTHGGYQIPVSTSGEYTVTFSGGGLNGTVSKTVTVDDRNVKVDARADEFISYKKITPAVDPTAQRAVFTGSGISGGGCSLNLTRSGTRGATGLAAVFLLLGVVIRRRK